MWHVINLLFCLFNTNIVNFTRLTHPEIVVEEITGARS